MEKHYTTDAITLKSYDLNDADKIVVMYSKERGLVRSVAKGIKRPKSKLGSRLDLLMANNLQLMKGRNMDTICQVQTINHFKNIREDISKLMITSYLSEIVANFGMENDPSAEEVYNLLYNAMENVAKSETKTETLLTAIKFQLKIMHVTGILPELIYCLHCGEKLVDKPIHFSVERGGVFCKCCDSVSNQSIEIPYKLRDFLVSMFDTDFSETNEYETRATEKICTVCFNLLKNYISKHSTKQFKSEKLLANVL